MLDGLLFDSLARYIGRTVTIFTTSGGLSGSGFTGVLAAVTPTVVKLITDIGAAPACPIGSSCDCNNCGCGCNDGCNGYGYGYGGYGLGYSYGYGYNNGCNSYNGCNNYSSCGCGCGCGCGTNWLGSASPNINAPQNSSFPAAKDI